MKGRRKKRLNKKFRKLLKDKIDNPTTARKISRPS